LLLPSPVSTPTIANVVFFAQPVGELMTVPSDRALTAAGKVPRYLEFSLLCIVSILIWWKPLIYTLKLALNSDSYTHILLILPISLALIVTADKLSLDSSLVRWPGWILLVIAVLLRVALFWTPIDVSASNALSLSVFALILWWIGAVIECFGIFAVRSRLFALGFLFLIVPVPDRAQMWMVEALQRCSAVATEMLFRIAHVPVIRDGVILSIPGLDLEVARECSSIRSSTMLVVLTLVLAHLFLRSNWRKLLLLALAIPLSVAKNAIRIFTIAELTTRIDPSYLHGRLHHQGGVVFLSLAALVITLLLYFLRSGEASEKSVHSRPVYLSLQK
jgi:exosortase